MIQRSDLCSLHNGTRLPPVYCRECRTAHDVCQQCGEPIEYDPYSRCYSDPHTGSFHHCDLTAGMWLGNDHECSCGAVITRFDDGCTVDYGTHTRHVCQNRQGESGSATKEPAPKPAPKAQPGKNGKGAESIPSRPKTVSI